MWTPKKRPRVTRACDNCKRKKKQCSGTQPCATCHSRSVSCTFSAQSQPQHQNHPQQNQQQHSYSRASLQSHDHSDNNASDSQDGPLHHKAPRGSRRASIGLDNARKQAPPSPKEPPGETATPIQNRGRLLQDDEGRLGEQHLAYRQRAVILRCITSSIRTHRSTTDALSVYLGDSATLSFLQTIRRLVEKRLGPSTFTTDAKRHKILEATVTGRDAVQHNYALPDRESARCMVDSFFTNTAGLCDIFDRQSFENKVSETFEQPLDADPQWLCQLNLVFAVGFQMRNDRSIRNDNASQTLDRLECPGVKRAERFYLAARQLSDPAVDFEAGGIGVLQSLLLILLYMLASSRRSSAWGYLGRLRSHHIEGL
ncbi:Thiamine repressible genes regulatory protein [Lachnellula occidentalis]|uniref:Thiamine repressible genes regulatory protein n=1 Tax=Lachnellula occidentalis TaxID=215460 RepID=A0A8H8RZX0_9HELO|nr:Thiamine repressible genes regulatory protein [Lachnellula occidentalis]